MPPPTFLIVGHNSLCHRMQEFPRLAPRKIEYGRYTPQPTQIPIAICVAPCRIARIEQPRVVDSGLVCVWHSSTASGTELSRFRKPPSIPSLHHLPYLCSRIQTQLEAQAAQLGWLDASASRERACSGTNGHERGCVLILSPNEAGGFK